MTNIHKFYFRQLRKQRQSEPEYAQFKKNEKGIFCFQDLQNLIINPCLYLLLNYPDLLIARIA